jgi:hypothetical protein
MTEKKDFDADRTIQLDQIDPSEVGLESKRDLSAGLGGRTTPPPLPPEAFLPPSAASVPPISPPSTSVRASAPPPKKSAGKSVALIGVFLVLLAGMIFLGLKLGDIVRGEPPAASVTPSATPTVAASAPPAPTPSATPSIQTITLPPIEMR